MGAPAYDPTATGGLLSAKMTMDAVLAYGRLAEPPAGTFSAKGTPIVAYVLCGFENIGSVAILIGMLAPIMRGRADEIVQLGR